MSGERVLSEENLSTIAAVTFVLALVSLSFNFFLFSRQNELATLAASFDEALSRHNTEERAVMQKQITKLEGELRAIEARVAALNAPLQ